MRAELTKSNCLASAAAVFGVGMFLALAGVLTSGAGHGPFPELSVGIALLGAIVALLALFSLLMLALMPAQLFSSASGLDAERKNPL